MLAAVDIASRDTCMQHHTITSTASAVDHSTAQQFLDGVLTAALPSRWCPDRTSQQRLIVLVGETSAYRSCARTLSLPTDRVMELGCSWGDCTRELAARVQLVRAADNSADCIERCTAQLVECPNVETHLLDVFGNPQQTVSLGAGVDVVYCDLGGSRALSAAYIALVLLLQQELRPNIMVIKCRAMHAAAVRASGSSADGGVLPISSAHFWSELQTSFPVCMPPSLGCAWRAGGLRRACT